MGPRAPRPGAEAGLDDVVEFLGYVDEQRKHEESARAWLLAAPSIKEGWGLVVVEAATAPGADVGYRDAGGLSESVADGKTGVLVDDLDGFVDAVARLIEDAETRRSMGSAAAARAGRFQLGRRRQGVGSGPHRRGGHSPVSRGGPCNGSVVAVGEVLGVTDSPAARCSATSGAEVGHRRR